MEEKLHQRLDRVANELGLWELPRSEARNRIFAHYDEFAVQLAQIKHKKNPRADLDDFIQYARMGLLEAIDSYDPRNERGASFTTFSGMRIRGSAEEATRDNDWVGHKIRSELGDTLPKMGHFADEHTGKKRAENAIPDREPNNSADDARGDLAAAMAKWPADVRETVELFLDCGWDVEEFIRRVYGPDSTVSESLLWRCGPQEKAVKYLKSVLRSVGAADATISKYGVRYMPPVQAV
jgi:RNA polymerase sigma factor (sigma-70 family)